MNWNFFSRKYDTIEKNIIQKNITHMSKKIIHGDEARRALAKGMDILVEAVAVTIGPRGRNVVIDNAYGSPQIINDGVTIAKEIEWKDNAANTGVGLIKQAALKTNDVAGDGTTTATVLAWAMVSEGLRNVAAGANPMSLKKGIEAAIEACVESIRSEAIDVSSNKEQIANVAAISSADTEIGGGSCQQQFKALFSCQRQQ